MVLYHKGVSDQALFVLLKNKRLKWVGNQNLKIYGKLNCKTGKRMKRENRIFFTTETEATELGYRPCGHCMRVDYKRWKNGLV